MHKLSRERAHQCSRDEREQDQLSRVVEERDRVDRKGDDRVQRHRAEVGCVANPERQALDQDHKCRKDGCCAQSTDHETPQPIPGVLARERITHEAVGEIPQSAGDAAAGDRVQ